MKKFFTLCLSMMMGCFAFNAEASAADDVIQFTDSLGTAIPDGSKITSNELHIIDWGMGDEYIEHQISSGLFVKNTSDAATGMELKLNVKSVTNGSMTICFPMNCVSLPLGSYTTDFDAVFPGDPRDIQLHLSVKDKNATATAEVELQIIRYDVDLSSGFPKKGQNSYPGSTITVSLTSDQTAGINDVTVAGNSKEVARYSLDGTRLSAPQKGINIVKYADGRTVKVLEK